MMGKSSNIWSTSASELPRTAMILSAEVVESLHNALGVYALRYAVAGSVVDDVAQDAHHVTLLRLEKVESTLQGWQTAMNIRK